MSTEVNRVGPSLIWTQDGNLAIDGKLSRKVVEALVEEQKLELAKWKKQIENARDPTAHGGLGLQPDAGRECLQPKIILESIHDVAAWTEHESSDGSLVSPQGLDVYCKQHVCRGAGFSPLFGHYDGIVLAAHPKGLSQQIAMDLQGKILSNGIGQFPMVQSKLLAVDGTIPGVFLDAIKDAAPDFFNTMVRSADALQVERVEDLERVINPDRFRRFDSPAEIYCLDETFSAGFTSEFQALIEILEKNHPELSPEDRYYFKTFSTYRSLPHPGIPYIEQEVIVEKDFDAKQNDVYLNIVLGLEWKDNRNTIENWIALSRGSSEKSTWQITHNVVELKEEWDRDLRKNPGSSDNTPMNRLLGRFKMKKAVMLPEQTAGL